VQLNDCGSLKPYKYLQDNTRMSLLQMKVLLCVFVSFLVSGDSRNCSTSLFELEKQLYEGLDNAIQLNQAFFPQLERTSRYIKVEYEFEGSELENCTVTYYWAIGGFLLIQPPKVFQFTSLYFSYPANLVESITLRLPEECLPIVYNETTQMCSCKSVGDTLLDVLSHHVSVNTEVGIHL